MEKPSLRSFLQFFRDIPGTFSGSVREFSRLSNLIGAAMILALSVVLSYFSIRIPPFKIGFAYLATAMLGMLFGPVMGGAAAGLGDIIKYFITPSDGAFFPGYTLSAILGGVIYGIFFYKNKTSVTRCILAKFCVNFFINILLGTYWYSIVGHSRSPDPEEPGNASGGDSHTLSGPLRHGSASAPGWIPLHCPAS